MGVEQDGWKLGFESRPGHDEDRLSGHHLRHVVVEAEPVGLDLQELDASDIVRVRLNGFDPDVVPEESDGRVLA